LKIWTDPASKGALSLSRPEFLEEDEEEEKELCSGISP